MIDQSLHRIDAVSVAAETHHKVSAPGSVMALQSFLSYGLASATAETDKNGFV